MNSITFENSTIADILTKAARISPREGSAAFGFTPGVFIQVMDDGSIVVRATDGQIYYTQWSNSIEHSGGSWEWHVTERIAKWCSGLPFGTNKLVKFTEENGMLVLRHARKVHKVALIEGMSYPHWEPFDESGAVTVEGLYSKIDQVQWAAALGSENVEPAFQGICLDGESIIAANQFRFAKLPLDFPPAVERPIAFPHKQITPMLKAVPDVPVFLDGNNIGFVPDDYSQIYIRSYADAPQIRAKRLVTDYEHYVEFNNEVLSNSLRVMIDSVGQSEHPVVKLMFMNESIFLTMRGKGGDIAQDVIEVPGFAKHEEPCVISYDPNILLRAITNTPRHNAKFHYNSGGAKVNYITCDNYQVWIAQRWEPKGDS